MRRVMLIGLATLTMSLAACGGGSIGDAEGASNGGAQDSEQGFLLEENTDAVTRGRLITGDGSLSFYVISEAAVSTILRVTINGKIFDLKLDASVTIEGHDAVLGTADYALLRTLVGELRSRFEAETTVTPGIRALVNFGAYLSDAPSGYVHRRLVDGVALPEGVAASAATSVICITKGTTRTAVYDNKYGSTIYKSVLVGSDWGRNAAGTSGNYSCMGGCGAGCPYTGKTKYTQDCLNHDTCSHDLNSSGGLFDTHGCADEFSAASDDYNSSLCPLQ